MKEAEYLRRQVEVARSALQRISKGQWEGTSPLGLAGQALAELETIETAKRVNQKSTLSIG